MKKRKKDLIYGILFVVAFISYITYALMARHNLEKNHKLTIGIPYDCSSNGRGNAGRLNIEFTFKIDGKQYKSTTALLTSELSESDCRDYFIGKELPAVYLPSNPSNSLLLIRPKDFARFGYLFPDSLKWVLKYIKK